MNRKMSISIKPYKIMVILGPTASGKSDLAVEIAKKFNGEIISADSRQVYKGLNLGSGKVPISYKPYPDESTKSSIPPIRKKGGINMYYRGIKHHLIDVASPKKVFTVTQYQNLGQKAIKKILAKNKLPIICGGTGLYIDSLIYGNQFPEVPPQPELRKKLEELSTEKLFEKLKKLDPQRAKNIDQYNHRRLIRALEIVITTGKPVPLLTPFAKGGQGDLSYNNTLFIGIKKSNEELKKLITKRLYKRLKIGMVKEVENLHSGKALSPNGKPSVSYGVNWKRLDDLGLEYRFISRYLRGLITKAEMENLIIKESIKYAKRQMTWFKRNSQINWVTNKKESLLLTKNFLIK